MQIENQADQRQLVLSKRLLFAVHRGSEGLVPRRAAGSLATALEALPRKRRGAWLGWTGMDPRPDAQVAAAMLRDVAR